jgi:hypothetical protein
MSIKNDLLELREMFAKTEDEELERHEEADSP